MTNEKPPICNYEGSDYQSSFWDKGERAYEDAVERVALRRLLSEKGELLLELGAGAGRNTDRYTGFNKIVLVDYSRTQLEQAVERLGLDGRYIYVAADVYQLPFVDELFDAATMIRALHHMADAKLALQKVRRVLQDDAVFILEFANKRNIKAILRYFARRQEWNPFTPEPVEFAALNYDFHPQAIRSWLQAAGFVIKRQLTVSHFRIGLLKKIIPLSILVGLDSIAQLTGNMWQFTPSVFVRAKAVGNPQSEKEDLHTDAFFKCVACGNPMALAETSELICENCGQTFSYQGGIYDFRLR